MLTRSYIGVYQGQNLTKRKLKLSANVPVAESEKTVAASSSSQPSRVRLPKMDIQKFSGQLSQWQEFWDTFNSCIHKNKSLTAVEKFTYLRNYLVDSARACVAGFALTDANYEAAIEVLKERFGKDSLLKRTHINSILCLVKVTSRACVPCMTRSRNITEHWWLLEQTNRHTQRLLYRVFLKGFQRLFG